MIRIPGAVLLLGLATACLAVAAPADEPGVIAAVDAAADSTAARAGRGSTVVLPVLAYTPDTGLMLGAFALRFFHLDPPGDDTRPSVVSPAIIQTFKSQLMVFLGTDLNWGRGLWHGGLQLGYQKFPDDFYGLGRDVPADPLENYTPEQFSAEAQLDRRVVGDLRLGAGGRISRHQLLETEPGGVLDGGLVPGTGESTIWAPGVLAAWDSRDDTWSPRRGLWLQAGTSFHRALAGENFRFTDYSADLRAYLPAGDRGAIAVQLLHRSIDGDAPFHALPRLGGMEGLRGYSGGRFMDRAMALARAEWRSGPVWKRFGWVVFAGLGDVAPRPGALTTAAGLTTFGGGLRWTVSPAQKVNLRMDFGFGRDEGGFFLSLGEAF